MLIDTNTLDLVVTAFMLLSFFYIIYSTNKQKYYVNFIISLLLLSLISTGYYCVFKNSLIALCLLPIVNVTIFTIMDQKNILEHIFISLYFTLLKLLSYVIVTWVIDLVYYDVLFPISYTIYLSDILLFIFLLSTVKLFKKYLFKIREYTAFYITTHIVLILIYLSYLISIFKKGELLIESSIEIFLISILVFLMYKMINKVIVVEKESYLTKLNNEELRFNQRNYNDIVDNVNEIKSIKHDMNHFLLLLLNYSTNNEYEKMHDVLVNRLDLLNDTNPLIYAGNSSLNLILSSKVSKIKKENIEFISNTFDEKIDIDKIDFYVLLGNLLDNAIEHCTSQSIKKILLDMYTEEQSLIIWKGNTFLDKTYEESLT